VLESDGIILERTSEKKFNTDQLIKKLAFVKEVRTGLSSKFDDLGGGEYIKNLEKRIQGEKNG
jgi:hypothetical protein